MRAKIESSLIFISGIFYLFVFPHGAHGDGFDRYLALITLLERGELISMLYSYWGPLFASPLYYLGHLLKTPHWWITRYNTLLFFGFLFWSYRWIRRRENAEYARVFVLFCFAGGMFSKAVTDFYGEMFTVCLIAIGLAVLSEPERWARVWWAKGMIAFGAASTPGVLPATLLALLSRVISTRQLRFFLPLIGAVMLLMLENFVRYGSVLQTGYKLGEVKALYPTVQPYAHLPGFSYPLGFGLLSTLFSFGKGLVFYVSGILLFSFCWTRVAAIFRPTLLAWLLFSLGLILVYAQWWAWFGGWYWGPRFYLFLSIPACFALTWARELNFAGLWQRWVFICLGTLSIWVSCTGVVFGLNNTEACVPNSHFICLYVPEFSELWRPLIAETGLRGRRLAMVIYFALLWVYLIGPALVRAIRETFSWFRRICWEHDEAKPWRF